MDFVQHGSIPFLRVPALSLTVAVAVAVAVAVPVPALSLTVAVPVLALPTLRLLWRERNLL